MKEAAESEEFHHSKGCKIEARKSNHFELVPKRLEFCHGRNYLAETLFLRLGGWKKINR